MKATPKRSAVFIDPEVARLLKIVAARKGKTVKALTETAILQWCRRQPEYREQKTA